MRDDSDPPQPEHAPGRCAACDDLNAALALEREELEELARDARPPPAPALVRYAGARPAVACRAPSRFAAHTASDFAAGGR